MVEKKLVSVCILVYNQEDYVSACVNSVLIQNYSNLEIIISDDNSSDKSWKIIQDITNSYRGLHKIKTNKNQDNLGLAQHYSMVASKIASGEYLIFIGGDDLCLPNHLEVAMNYANSYPDVVQIDFSAEVIDENSNFICYDQISVPFEKYTINDFLDLKLIRSFAPGRIIKKEMFVYFGPISNSCPTEDSVTVLRSLLFGGFLRVNDITVKYRKLSSSLSSLSGLKNMNNELIIYQNLNDINKFFSDGFINGYLYQKLIQRVLFQLSIKNLNNAPNSLKSRMLHISYRFLYFFQSIIGKHD